MQSENFEFAKGVQFPLIRGGKHDCPYLPGKEAEELYLASRWVDSAIYQQLMDNGFRRSGQIFYKPDCGNCKACQSIRVKVSDFKISKSQRKALNKNRDIEITLSKPSIGQEKFELYNHYQNHQHDGGMSCDIEEYAEMFFNSSVDALEMQYRLEGKLIGVGLVDITEKSISSVYFYFDPDHSKRSLGIFSALMEIEECKKRNLPYWYLGFYVEDCQKMAYKSKFKPYEILKENGEWEPVRNESQMN